MDIIQERALSDYQKKPVPSIVRRVTQTSDGLIFYPLIAFGKADGAAQMGFSSGDRRDSL